MEVTSEFVEEEWLATAPLGEQTHGDGHGQGGLTEHVCQRRAVQVIAEQLLIILVGVQSTYKQA